MKIEVKRVYDEPSRQDGARILVDRLWPRGVSKKDAAIDHWAKELAPSTELRKWFNHQAGRWEEFRKRYQRELQESDAAVRELLDSFRDRPITLLYAAKDRERNHALVLQEVLRKRGSQR